MGNSGKPQKPVRTEKQGAGKNRTVTPAPSVARSDPSAFRLPPSAFDLRTRGGQLSPGSIDLDDHTVEAVLGTERACLSMDLKTKKSFLEVYLMSGAVLPGQVPLCDTHNRESTAKVLGSVRDLRIENDSLLGRLFVASSEYGVSGQDPRQALDGRSVGRASPWRRSRSSPARPKKFKGDRSRPRPTARYSSIRSGGSGKSPSPRSARMTGPRSVHYF